MAIAPTLPKLAQYRDPFQVTLSAHHDLRQYEKEILPANLLSNALLVESLDAVLSIEYWITLRKEQQLSVAKALRVMRYAATQLTGSASE